MRLSCKPTPLIPSPFPATGNGSRSRGVLYGTAERFMICMKKVSRRGSGNRNCKKWHAQSVLSFSLPPLIRRRLIFWSDCRYRSTRLIPELVDIPLIEKMARTGKPLILSTGMASLTEIEEAVAAARKAGASEICLLKCTSAYPAQPEHANLRTLVDLSAHFEVPVGLSDHTLGCETAIVAVALGACLVEKHFTASRAIPGPDSAFSLEPDEFRDMVRAIRKAEKSLGSICYGASSSEQAMLSFRRSLFVAADIEAGEAFTEKNVRSIRPAHGLHPRYLPEILGRKAARAVRRGSPLTWDMVADVL